MSDNDPTEGDVRNRRVELIHDHSTNAPEPPASWKKFSDDITYRPTDTPEKSSYLIVFQEGDTRLHVEAPTEPEARELFNSVREVAFE